VPKPDPAHKETDKILAEMEKKLHEVYKQAYKEARETADDFMKKFREMDKKKREAMKNGDLDKDEYARWRRTQIFQGNNYHKMADTLAADMTNSNKIAASVINGYLPEVYAVNYNYGTYEIEKGSKINTSFTLYDRQTVERLLRDEPDLLPRKAKVDIPKDKEWNKKHINSAITQGILQGESIDKISQRLAATVTDMSQTSAIRNARTMTTSAQNGGRIDSYKRAESMGISMMQVWMSTLDSRTRHEHILLDGQKRKVGEPFEVDGEKIYFPGDPSAEPYLVYNCRCTLIGEVKGIDYKLSDVSQRDNKLGDMTYQEWKDSKRKQDEGEPSEPKKEPKQPEKEPEKPKFTPATTLEEAEKYAQKFAGNVKYKGLSLDAVNIINETLTELTERFPIKALDNLVSNSRLKRAAARANFCELEIKPTIGKEGRTAEEVRELYETQLKKYKEAVENASPSMKKQYNKAIRQIEEALKYKRWTVGDITIKATIAHEYGHILADQYCGQINSIRANPKAFEKEAIDMRNSISQAYREAKKSGDIYNISQYGATDEYEFFAETFAAYFLGEKLPDYIEDMLKGVLDHGAV
jgi:vacuolar-type H+-ATPase subunit H